MLSKAGRDFLLYCVLVVNKLYGTGGGGFIVVIDESSLNPSRLEQGKSRKGRLGREISIIKGSACPPPKSTSMAQTEDE